MSVVNILVYVNTEHVPIFQEDLIVVVSWDGRVNSAWMTSMNVKIRILAAITQSVTTL